MKWEANIVACDCLPSDAGLSIRLDRIDSDEFGIQLSIVPSSCQYVKLDRYGVSLLIKYLQNSLEQ